MGISRKVLLSTVTCVALGLSLPWQLSAQVDPSWNVGLSLGAGMAHVAPGPDPVRQSGTVVLVGASVSKHLASQLALGVELELPVWENASDCIQGFTVCAPAARYKSAHFAASYSFSAKREAWIPTVTLGVGAARLAAAEWGTQTLAREETLASYELGLDVPVAVLRYGGVILGFRNAWVHGATGGAVTTWNVRLGYELWLVSSKNH